MIQQIRLYIKSGIEVKAPTFVYVYGVPVRTNPWEIQAMFFNIYLN